MNALIDEIYRTGLVVGRSGTVHRLHSAVDREEGELLSRIIRDDSGVTSTLEIGCAYGLSSLFICTALQERAGALHTIIDPFQQTAWDGVGLVNLERAGFVAYRLIEERSEFALPDLLREREGQLDLVFVDGRHTFDHALLDCFYATRLLRVGGYLVLDDISFPAVRRVFDFLSTYPCYELHSVVGVDVTASLAKRLARRLMMPVSRGTLARLLSKEAARTLFDDVVIRCGALKKIAEDKRTWDWHDDAF